MLDGLYYCYGTNIPVILSVIRVYGTPYDLAQLFIEAHNLILIVRKLKGVGDSPITQIKVYAQHATIIEQSKSRDG